MAGLSVEYKSEEWMIFRKLMKIFPVFQASAMGYVGGAARIILKKRLLSGQELNLKGDVNTVDNAGRQLISRAKIGKDSKFVRISSYPLNLFEHGRGLPGGKTEPGRKIMTVKLKAIMAGELQGIINRFDKTILEQEINKITK